MSKIIVDQIAKNGGATLTIPAADGTAANQPVVTDGSGVLGFSPLALPAADSAANKVLITNGSGQLGFGATSYPAIAGTAGQLLTSAADGTSSFVTQAPTAEWVTVYDHAVHGNVTWFDHTTTTAAASLKGFEIRWNWVTSASAGNPTVYPLSAAGSTINTGNSFSFWDHMYSNSSTTSGSNTNSFAYMNDHTVGGDVNWSFGFNGMAQISYNNQKKPNCWSMIWDTHFRHSTNTSQSSRNYGAMHPYNTSNNMTGALGGFRFGFNGVGLTGGQIQIREMKV